MEEDIITSDDPPSENREERKILIVDDAAMFRDLESLFLARSGEVMTACDAEEAWEILHRERPDIVVTDLLMPGMDGDELCRRIKADPDLRRIPIVVLTTSEAEEDVLRSYDLHANAYVTKPVDFDRFVEVIRQIDDFFISVVRLPTS